MFSIDVSNDRKDRQQIPCFEYDCVSLAREPHHLVVVVG